MSTSKSAVFDEDLNPVLNACTNEELQYLVDLLTGTFTNFLDIDDDYKKYYPDHRKYSDLIASHIRRFGGNSFANFIRALKDDNPKVTSIGPKYKEIVCDVAGRLKVSYNKNNSVDELEMLILKNVTEKFLSKATKEQKEAFLKAMGVGMSTGQSVSTCLGLLVSSAPMALVVSVMPFLFGPVITGAWFVSSEAYRITIPAVIYVAILRKRQRLKKYGVNV